MTDDLTYVKLIQELNRQLVRQHHSSKNNKFSEILGVLSEYNESIASLNIQFDFILENQRGMQFFGIPLFSKNSLMPMIDPSNYQSIQEKLLLFSEHTMNNFPLPDLHWEWAWETWYILMYNDVDDQGWVYSNLLFNKSMSDSRWKGKYYFGNFIRRRIWIRMRVKLPVDE